MRKTIEIETLKPGVKCLYEGVSGGHPEATYNAVVKGIYRKFILLEIAAIPETVNTVCFSAPKPYRTCIMKTDYGKREFLF